MERYLDLFINELLDYVKQLNRLLLKLEKNTHDSHSIIELFRVFHTVKGMSQTMGYNSLVEISHAAENLLEKAKAHGEIQQMVIDALLRVTDLFDRSAASLTAKEKLPDARNILDLLEKLEQGKDLPSYVAAERRGDVSDIRIKVEKLDKLFNLTNELMIMKSRITKISEASSDSELRNLGDTAARLIATLQDEVTKLRMLPLSTVFDFFPRWFRDEAKRQKKNAELKIMGAEIEVDRSVIDTLKEPLMHLVRNALDHGIQRGVKGNVMLSAVREKERIHISVRDDGMGLDPEFIRRTAVSRKILTEADSRRMSQDDVYRLILRPDFSTRKDVTTLSGRGIGLDIVHSAVVKLGGQLRISSQKGMYACFTLELPVSLATVRAIIFKLNGQRFALPLNYVQETFYVSPRSLKSVYHRELFPLREELIAVTRLGDRLGCARKEGRESLIIVQYGGKKRGFIANDIIDEEEIVVKSVSTLLRNPAYSGCSIYADGLPILILDPRGLE